MTKRLLPLIAGIVLLFAIAPAHAKTVDNIAAVVNNNIITLTDVQDRTKLYLSGQKLPPAARKEMEEKVLNKLIDEKLELQEAKKIGISISEDQINTGFAFIARQNHLTPDAFKNKLQKAGVNINTLYAQIKAELAWNEVIQRKIKPQINVSESDIDMTMKQLAHGTKKEYHIAEIMLQVPTVRDKMRVLSRAQDLVRKIRSGADFAKVAREYSQGAAASSGGDLGWVERGQLSRPLDQALKSLQPGEITDPVFANNSYHILFLLDTRATASANDAASAQGPIVDLKQIVIPVKKSDSQNVIKAKLARAIALGGEVKSCAAMDKEMKNFPYKGTGDLGSGPQNALPAPVNGIVAKLAVGELSQPIKTPHGWAVLMVCARHTPSGASATAAASGASAATPSNLSLDEKQERQQVADKLGMQRLNQMAAHYLSDLRAAAFIDKHI